MKILLPGDGAWATWVLVALLIVWRIVLPAVFAQKASGKGYSYYIFMLLGVVVSPLLCILLAWFLPDKKNRERMRVQAGRLEAESDELCRDQDAPKAKDGTNIL